MFKIWRIARSNPWVFGVHIRPARSTGELLKQQVAGLLTAHILILTSARFALHMIHRVRDSGSAWWRNRSHSRT
jgi:hypothetical protein